MSIVASLLVSLAVVAMFVALACIVIHPHVCSLMQGDWGGEPGNEPPRTH